MICTKFLRGAIAGILIFSASFIFGQAGMNIYAGPSVMFSQDPNFTPSGQYHSGYVTGLHGRLNSDAMYFLLSGEYGAFSLLPSKDIKFLGKGKLTYFKFKVGLGADIINISNKAGIRIKAQGSLLSASNYEETLLSDPRLSNGYNDLNDGSAGISTGVGLFLGPLTVDLGYEHGIINFIKAKKDSKLNFLDLVVGLRF